MNPDKLPGSEFIVVLPLVARPKQTGSGQAWLNERVRIPLRGVLPHS
jgi:hypothetical protein